MMPELKKVFVIMWIISTNNGNFEGKRLKKTLREAAEWCAINDENSPLIKDIDFDGKYFTHSFPGICLKASFYLEDVLERIVKEMRDEENHRKSLTRYYEGTRF